MIDTRNNLLSTSDNPFNPHTSWDEWLAWDTSHGYHSLSLLARVGMTSDELPSSLQDEAVEDAIEEIVTENLSGMHISVAAPPED